MLGDLNSFPGPFGEGKGILFVEERACTQGAFQNVVAKFISIQCIEQSVSNVFLYKPIGDQPI